MQKPFSAGAEHLSAIAAYLLGWTPDQFWNATPSELTTIFAAAHDTGGQSGEPLDNIQFERMKDKFPDG